MRVRYQAIDDTGKKHSGEIEAEDEKQALDQLADLGLVPIDVRPTGVAVPWWQRDVRLGAPSINRAALYDFLFHLSCLLDAKLPLMDAMSLLQQKTSDRGLKAALTSATTGVANGKPLSTALADADRGFPPQVLAALEVGEQSNTLAHAAGQTARSLDAQIKLKSTLVGAATYPVILLIMSAIVLGIVLFYLLPILEPVFASTVVPGAASPLAPLIAMRTVVVVFAQSFGLLVVVLFLTFPIWRNAPAVARALDRLPILGALRRDRRSQFLSETLSSLLASGADLNTALSVVSRTAPGDAFRQDLQKTHARVLDGESFAKALSNAPSVDPMVRQLAELGEKSEQLPQLMQVAADLLEAVMKRRIERMMALLVPTLTIVVGLVVGSMVLITMSAVLSVNDLAQ